jgi:prepilin-type N-terminal cleavage/methylation domain-containing protein
MTRRAAGFTLVELLVTVAITGIVLSSVYGIVVSTLVARDRIDEASETDELGPAILDLIEADLRGLFPYDVDGLRIFRGRDATLGGEDADSIDLVTTTTATIPEEATDGSLLRADVCEVGYRVKESEDNPDFRELWRREQNHLDADPMKGGTYQKLTGRLRGLDLRYLVASETATIGAPPTIDEEREWDSSQSGLLPVAVKITLALDLFPGKVDADVDPDYVKRYLKTYVRTIPLERDLLETASLRPLSPAAAQAGGDGGPAGPGGDGPPGGPPIGPGSGGPGGGSGGTGGPPPPPGG